MQKAARGDSKGRGRDETRWRAVMARDPSSDGAFVFGVRSTGIYCRPSCPARRPRRSQVVFFAVPEAAEGAGFRSCRRCRPREPREPLARWIARACRYIEDHTGGPVLLEDLSREVGVSPHHLQRTFKRALGVTPRQYADARRLGTFKSHLRKGDAVTGSLYEAGYGSSSRIYEDVGGKLGMTPGAYRRGGRGMRIAYTVVGSPLGRLLVAATERGVSAVSLGSSTEALESALREEYPAALLERDEAGMRRFVEGVLGAIRGEEPSEALPLDVRATAFQRRVWEALRQIPRGATRSYGEIARAVGRPGAARAVARACATNPVSILVPCHRVVGGDGALTGYRWGLEKKRALLRLEGAASEAAGRRR